MIMDTVVRMPSQSDQATVRAVLLYLRGTGWRVSPGQRYNVAGTLLTVTAVSNPYGNEGLELRIGVHAGQSDRLIATLCYDPRRKELAETIWH